MLKLKWPDSLSDVTRENVTVTELWFLKQTMESGAIKIKTSDIQMQPQKFGYSECYVDIGEQRYLVKYKSWVNFPISQIIFFVEKLKPDDTRG